MTSIRALLVAAVCGALLTLTPLATGTAGAADPTHGPADATATASKARNYWGAIAISRDAAWGVAYDHRSKSGALKAAQRRCKSHSSEPGQCRKVGWVRNACGAVAVKYYDSGAVRRYKFGYGQTKNAAKSRARRNFGGDILTWVCTTRPR